MADIHKTTILYSLNHSGGGDLDCTPGSWEHVIFCYMLQNLVQHYSYTEELTNTAKM